LGKLQRLLTWQKQNESTDNSNRHQIAATGAPTIASTVMSLRDQAAKSVAAVSAQAVELVFS
jgi:hypothetical protein